MLVFNIDLFQYSAHCGEGYVTRKVHCLGQCDEGERPEERKVCDSGRECGGEWFTGRWSVCSHPCGQGVQRREVVCGVEEVVGEEGRWRLVGEEQCAGRRRPRDERRCHIQRCREQWFTAGWGQVSYSGRSNSGCC